MATKQAPSAQPTGKHVIGPDGRRLTVADLPSADTRRWVVRRKAEVVAAGLSNPLHASIFWGYVIAALVLGTALLVRRDAH